MITAEQVREAIEENSWEEAFMLREFNESSWQAIADDLNATLDTGTCKRVKRGTKMDGSPKLRCSECGYGIGDKRWFYCPKCGRKVVSE